MTWAVKRQGQGDWCSSSRHSLVYIVSPRQETGELCDNGDRNWKNADIGCWMLRFLYENPGKYQGRFSPGASRGIRTLPTCWAWMTTNICCPQTRFYGILFLQHRKANKLMTSPFKWSPRPPAQVRGQLTRQIAFPRDGAGVAWLPSATIWDLKQHEDLLPESSLVLFLRVKLDLTLVELI